MADDRKAIERCCGGNSRRDGADLHDRRHRLHARRRDARGDDGGDRARGPGVRRGDARRGAQAHPMGILSRGVSGIAGRTLIVNFPGNPKAIGELFPVIAPDARARRDDIAARGWTHPRPLSCGASTATSVSGRCCGTSRCRCPRARRSPCSGATARANRRCCGSSRRCCARTRARCSCSARRCRGARSRCAAGRIARPRAAALPRPQRPREPQLPRAAARGRRPSEWSELLEAVGMRRARRRAGALAARAGMVQRWRSCRAVLHAPELLLLDEPRRTSTRRRQSWSSR